MAYKPGLPVLTFESLPDLRRRLYREIKKVFFEGRQIVVRKRNGNSETIETWRGTVLAHGSLECNPGEVLIRPPDLRDEIWVNWRHLRRA